MKISFVVNPCPALLDEERKPYGPIRTNTFPQAQVTLASTLDRGNYELEFLEPNLKFAKTKKTYDNAHIRIYFELEARPKWSHSNFAGKEDLYLDLNPTKDEIRKAIADLKNQLKKFPIRGKLNKY